MKTLVSVKYGMLSVTALANEMNCRTSHSVQETRFSLVLNTSNHKFLLNTSKLIVSTSQLTTQYLYYKHPSINSMGKHVYSQTHNVIHTIRM